MNHDLNQEQRFAPQQIVSLFDHLVGAGEEHRRHIEAEGLSGPQIDHKLECGRLHDRQVGGPFPCENPSSVDPELPLRIGRLRSVADETSGRGELTPIVNRGNLLACRRRDNLVASAEEPTIGADDKRAGSLLGERGEGTVQVVFPARVYNDDLLPHATRRGLYLAQVELRFRSLWVYE